MIQKVQTMLQSTVPDTSGEHHPNHDVVGKSRSVKSLHPVSREVSTNGNTNPGQQLTAADVWRAMCEDRICVHYQPQYEISTGKMVAAEALVRLVDRSGQLIYPDHFIYSAENCDLIAQLGRTVIDRVCATIASIRADSYELQRVAINLCAHQLNVDTHLTDFVDETLAGYGLDHSDLEFELTERQEIKPDSSGMAVLRALAARGGRIVIDDFGMGFSSMSYLTASELPVTSIKLDRASISPLVKDRNVERLVRNILTLAAELGLEVVAEGVEFMEQNQCLMEMGCTYAQGYGYARPMSADDLRAFIASKTCSQEGQVIQNAEFRSDHRYGLYALTG
jgi:EAL domain-containing protein (putative c-di-GMP-specific phosphodiesterase class I)